MSGDRPPYSRHRRRSRHHRHSGGGRTFDSARHGGGLPPRTRRLYRDPQRARLGGVCAGIAAYYGVEPWVVRLIAVTGLLFFPSIVIPAYWIAYFLLDRPPGLGEEPEEGSPGGAQPGHRDNHSSPAPELGARLSPRNSLRNLQADLSEVELRLRRMEHHVTSGQYELQRELNRIDGGGSGATRGR